MQESEGITLELVILEQLDLHRGYTAVDVYKLIYQAVFGVGHLLANEKEAYTLLREEFDDLSERLQGEKLLEVINAEGTVCRMNLRPYKATGGNLDRLFHALLLTRDAVTGTKMDFLCLWNEVKELTKRHSFPFSLTDMEKFESVFQKADLPVLHHSESYERFNRPSYRVIAVEYIEDLLGK